MLALIITCLGLFIYSILAEKRLRTANAEITRLREKMKKEGVFDVE